MAVRRGAVRVGTADVDLHLGPVGAAAGALQGEPRRRAGLVAGAERELAGLVGDERGGDLRVQRPRVGDVVVVCEGGVARRFWRLARIQEMIPGRDGISRTCRLKTDTGELTRAVQHLHRLPCADT